MSNKLFYGFSTLILTGIVWLQNLENSSFVEIVRVASINSTEVAKLEEYEQLVEIAEQREEGYDCPNCEK